MKLGLFNESYKDLKKDLNFRRFCQVFWPIMYPQGSDEEECYEYRYLIFEWLDRKLSQKLRQIPITNSSDADIVCFSLHDWANAMQLKQATKINLIAKKKSRKR